jgi:2-polyprenyl-3-methyl-5-hydroxy-6-metoxy-1,4-benzoquinol methylase
VPALQPRIAFASAASVGQPNLAEMSSNLDNRPASYYQGARDEMLRFIPEDAGTVLEIGCGGGNFGYRLKQRGAREVWGVEIVEAAGQKAQKLLDKVLIGDIAAVIDQLPEAYFDFIVFNDVLEHMVDPYDVLNRIKAKISPNGVVVSSIPNIRYYWTFRELLVYGEWEYEESGILDSTHLRFFTAKSILKMYDRLGYEVLRHEGINPITQQPRIYRLANLLLRRRLSDMLYIEFVSVAKPTTAERSADETRAAGARLLAGIRGQSLRNRGPRPR